MEVLVEIIGEIVLTVLQELWPPVLAVLDGGLVLLFAFLTWLYGTEGQTVKAVISLLAAVLFLAVGIVWVRSGACKRPGKNRKKSGK